MKNKEIRHRNIKLPEHGGIAVPLSPWVIVYEHSDKEYRVYDHNQARVLPISYDKENRDVSYFESCTVVNTESKPINIFHKK